MTVGQEVPYMGWQSVIAIGQQQTTTTFVTGSSYLAFNSESIKREIEESKLPHLRNSRAFHQRVKTNEMITGSIEFDLNVADDAQVYIFQNAMGGTAAVAVISAAVSFAHTLHGGDMETNAFSATGSDIKALSVGVRKGSTDTWHASFMRVNTLSIACEVGGVANVTAELVGMSVTTNQTVGAGAISYSTVVPMVFDGVTIQTGDSITNLGAECFTSMELSINNNLDSEQRCLGSRNLKQIPVGMREVTLTLGQRFDTMTSYNRAIQNTMTAIQLNFESGQTITSGVTTYSMQIKLPATYFNSTNPEVGGPDVITQESNVAAMYDSEKAYDIQMVITNGTSAYDI